MKYNTQRLSKEVAYYKKALSKKLGKGKICLIELRVENEKAFFSLAPLSRAIDSLGADVSVFVTQKESKMLKTLNKTWSLYRVFEQGMLNKETKALDDFIKSVEKKTKSKYFSKLF